jgi:hypothetical protein
MESFRKKTPVSVVIDCSRSKLEAEVSTRIRDLEPSNREEKEIVEVKAGMSEERIESAFHTREILLKAKEKARPSNRRRKIRVYIP